MFDPRAAVARLEQVPANPKFEANVHETRMRVAEMLELSHAARWRKTWGEFSSYAEMPDEIDPDPR
jgi:hypothetical protein